MLSKKLSSHRSVIWIPLLTLVVLPLNLFGQGSGLPPQTSHFIGKYCVRCHNAEEPKADLRLDNLGISQTTADAEYWQLVMDAIQLGDMPPAKELQPTIEEVEGMVVWIDGELQRAKSTFRGNTGEVVLRRLNRTEYQNVLFDLFGIQEDLTKGFPEDAKVHGFDNNGAALTLSIAQVEAYLEAARKIIKDSMVDPSAPPQSKRVTKSLQDWNVDSWERSQTGLEKRLANYDNLTAREKERTDHFADELKKDPYYAYVFPAFSDGKLIKPAPGQREDTPMVMAAAAGAGSRVTSGAFFNVSVPGNYRLSFRAFGIQVGNAPAELTVYRRTKGREGHVTPLRTIVLDDSESRDYVVECFLEPGWIIGVELNTNTRARGDQTLAVQQPMAGFDSLTFEGPIVTQWPPRGYETLVGPFDPKSSEADNVRGIILHAAQTLFRRPVDPATVEAYHDLYQQVKEGEGHESALRQTYKALLASPQFLYQVEFGEGVDPFALASRLSFFLWRSVPDRELLQLAANGQLTDPGILRQQTERMLNDPKAERFITDFVGQWMKTYHVGVMTPDKQLYPEWNDRIASAMVAETEGFFRELVVHDLPLSNLIDSDWTYLNETLANHYQIAGVKGPEMRKVKLDKSQTVRGGLLTQGTFLNVTSNGTATSPIIRGVWVLDHLLGTPTPAPPPDVPALEPDIRGAQTITEQLTLHRDLPQCASCHSRIDPIGLALENFDVVGGWRDNYRILNAERRGRQDSPWVDGSAVQTASEHPHFGAITSFEDLRGTLQEHAHLVYENTAHKLAMFALGRDLTFADDDDIHQIVRDSQAAGMGMRSMIHALVQNDLFQRP